MADRERDESGRYQQEIDEQDVIEAVENGGHIVTARDVADALGCTSEAARLKLTALHEAGKIERRKVGATAVVWWVQ